MPRTSINGEESSGTLGSRSGSQDCWNGDHSSFHWARSLGDAHGAQHQNRKAHEALRTISPVPRWLFLESARGESPSIELVIKVGWNMKS
jgi:hypothetical protein